MWLMSSALQASERNLCPKKFLARENLIVQEKQRFSANNFSRLLVVRQRVKAAARVGDSRSCSQKHLCILCSKQFVSMG